MNRAAAWSVRGVGQDTRDAAQAAARRAGVSLGEWLDDVIADRAAEQGVDPDDFDEDERLDAIGDRLSGLSRRVDPYEGRARRDRDRDRDRPRPRPRRVAADDSRRAEELLDEAISRFESRAARSEARTARALDSVASVIEVGRRDEREALHAVVGRLESLEHRIARQKAERDAGARRSAARAEPRRDHAAQAIEAQTARALDSVANLIEGVQSGGRDERESLKDVLGRLESLEARVSRQAAGGEPRAGRSAAAVDERAEAAPPIEARVADLPQRAAPTERSRAAPRPRPRFDIDTAVSQIAERRRELDARSKAAEPSAAPDAGAPNGGRDPGSSALHIEIRKLGQRLDDLRRDQAERREAAPVSVEALRADLAAMSRSLADLAPRNAVVALEGAIRDLSQRVAASRESGARESLLAPVEELVDSLREALRAHDPREAVQALRREIGAIGAKVDGIADARVDPRALEPILRQIEETRGLLGALAQRPMPLDRLERQIGELADRVETLATSATPHAESARLLAALDEARAQVERSASASALNSIEARLEEVAARIDQALERPLTAPAMNSRALEDLSLRIDGMRQAIEANQASPVGAPLDTSALEQAMREISAKLDRPVTAAIDTNAFETLFQDLGERIDRRPAPVVDTLPLERALRRLEEQGPGPDTTHLEHLMREISAKLDRPVTAAIDAHAFEDLFHELGARIDGRSASGAAPMGAGDSAQLHQLMREISEKLDRPAAAIDGRALEDMFHDLAARIDRRPAAVVDTAPLEQVLRRLGDRPATSDSGPLEELMHEISVKLDRATQPAVDAGAIEAMIRDLAARVDRRPEVVVDTRNLEQTLATIQDKIEQTALPRMAADRIEQALAALSSQLAARGAARDESGLEAMVAESLAQLEEIRLSLRNPSAPVARAEPDESVARDLAALRAEQTNTDRRLQSTLGGVHDMLETLVDRIGQIEDDVARVGQTPPPRESAAPPAPGGEDSRAPATAALNAMDASLRDPQPASKPVIGQLGDRAPLKPPPHAVAQPLRSIDGSEFLIEPGAGAPLRAGAADAIAPAGPKAAINAHIATARNAHIAAARRAAQAALAEAANEVVKETAKPAKRAPGGTGETGGLGRAKAFLGARRRPLLLGVALVALLAIVVVELGVFHPPSMQKSELPGAGLPRVASLEPARDAASATPAAPAKSEARALDPTPTGSLTAPSAGGPAPTKFQTPAPADLVAAIPAGTPKSLREAAAAGDPAAQFELASRLAEGRSLPRDLHAAFLWFDRAAAQGLVPAQYRLGSLYEKGLGVTRDPAAARSWYGKAADAGNARAMHNLAVLIAEGGGAKPDYAEAAGWFRKAAELGVRDSQFNLGVLYARGMGLGQDLGQAWLWFSLAAQQGDTEAAKKRDDVAAKMDAKGLAAAAAALAAFHAAAPVAAVNEVPAPPGGWDQGKTAAPQATNQPPVTPAAPI